MALKGSGPRRRCARVLFREASDGWHIILRAANGAKLGPIGEAYDTKSNARRGWAAICRAAGNHEVADR